MARQTDTVRLLGVLAAAGLAAPAFAGPGALNTNLVTDGSFENIDVNQPGPFSSFLLLDWQDFGTAFPVDPMNPPANDDNFAYTYFPTFYAYVSQLQEPGAGGFHYSGGFNTSAEEIQIFQQIVIPAGSGAADLIASGGAEFQLSAYFSTFFGQNEASFVFVSFADSNGMSLGISRDIGGPQFVSALGFDDEFGTISGDPFFAGTRLWGQDRTVGAIPVGTTSVFVAIGSSGGSGNYDGYVELVDFQVGTDFPPVLPGVFSIDTPVAGTFTEDNGPVVAWEESSLATGYRLVIDDNADLGSPEVDVNTTELSIDLADGSLTDGIWYAQVFAQNADGSTPAANGSVRFAVVTGQGGTPGCNPADLSGEFGVLDINDILIFAEQFNAGCP